MLFDVVFWVFVVLVAAGPFAAILMIGRRRDPMTRGSAVSTLVISVVQIWVLLTLYWRAP